MKALADEIRAEVQAAAARFRAIGEAKASADHGPGEWTAKQILGHLINSAENNHQLYVRAQLTSPFAYAGYDQAAWVELQEYAGRPWEELVDLWEALNRHLAAAIERVPVEKLGTPCSFGAKEPKPLEWWMRDYLRHLKMHIADIEAGR